MHLVGNNSTHPCNPPHYGLWIILYFFTICMCNLCFLPLLLVFVMKCVKMHCFLPHNPYCCSLPLPAHLYMHQLFTHCLPIIICVMLMSVVFFLCYFCCISVFSFLFMCMCFFLAFDFCVDMVPWLVYFRKKYENSLLAKASLVS